MYQLNGEDLPLIWFRGQPIDWFRRHPLISEQMIINIVQAMYITQAIEVDPLEQDGKHGIINLRTKIQNSICKITIRVHRTTEHERSVLIIHHLHLEKIIC